MLYKMCDNVALAGDLCRLATLKAMGKRRKIDIQLPPGEEVLGNQSVPDAVATHLFNLGLRAAGIPTERHAERREWKKNLVDTAPVNFFKPVPLPHCKSGEPDVIIYVASVSELFPEIVRLCDSYRNRLWNAMQTQGSKPFHLLCYHDECTGGNVLAPDSAKKVSFFYFAVRELGYLHSDTMWHPFAMVQHCQATQVQGGFGRVFLAIVESLRNEQLHLGIPMSFGQTMTLFVAEIQHWIGDLDALRVSFDAKGSAGLRVCIKCKNVLKRDSGVPARDDRFVEVACSKVELFDPQSDHEIFQVVDDLLMKKDTLPKNKLQQMEVVAGFLANPHGLLANPSARAFCPPSAWLLDVMHLYYSNGVCSWEVNALLTRTAEVGISLSLLQEVAEATKWQKAARCTCTPSWRKSLFDPSRFTGDSYRGCALDLIELLPLLYFHLEETVGRHDLLQLEMQSFRCLLEIHFELSRLKFSTSFVNTACLARLQKEHQERYSLAYGLERLKPKHHGRMHIAQQLQASQLYVDCLPMEKKHRIYKSFIAVNRLNSFCRGNRNAFGAYNRLCLERCYFVHLHALRNMTFGSAILSETKAVVHGRRMATGDVILAPCAGRVVRFTMSPSGQVAVIVERFKQISIRLGQSKWKVDGSFASVCEVEACPTWWSWTDDTCLCLH